MKYLILFLSIINLFAINFGEKVYTGKGCYGCHGIDGGGSGNYPAINKKSEYYFISKLNAYKNGEIKTPNADVMNPFAQSLTESEIKDLAKFLSNMTKQDDKEKYRLGREPWDDGGS